MNLTLQIDDDVLARARLRASQQGTSVNALVRSYLESYSGDDDDSAVRLHDRRGLADDRGDL